MKHLIEITETLQRVIEVEAEDVGQAVTKVARDYGCGNIILSPRDFVGYSIKEYEERDNG